ncbi:hypothetical protein [Nitrobacter sp.]|uniref:hypothetical protein n=1 Tax=Nitrobacter sp. TaxID=29420 RepID=UPI003F64ADE8
MARIKVRFKINQGRHGAPMAKLGKISEQAERFLRSLAADCDIESQAGEWLAVHFDNGSVSYDAEFQGDVPPGAAQIFTRNLEFLADFDPATEGLNAAIKPATALEYARIGSIIDPDEEIGLGIYAPDALESRAPRWRAITYRKSVALKREIETPVPSHGSVQGILHAWFKEAREPYFQLRELSTDTIVKVIYSSALYADVAKAVQQRTTMLMVSGSMLFDRSTRLAIELRADRIDPITMLSTAEFEEFFGSAPDYVAEMDADETWANG